MAQTIEAVVLARKDTMARWEEIDNIPLAGEIVIVTDVGRIKIGDGKRKFSELPFIGTEGKSIEVMVEGDLLKVRREGDPEWLSIIAKGEKGDVVIPTISEETENWVIEGEDTGKTSRGQKGDKGEATAITISEDGYWVLDGVKSQHLAVAPLSKLITYIDGTKFEWRLSIVNNKPVAYFKKF